MYLTGKIRVKAVIPEKLTKLEGLAYNLWWSWNPEVSSLFREIDPELWNQLGGNPVRFLQEVSQHRLNEKLNDDSFLNKYSNVTHLFDRYITEKDTWYNRHYPDKADKAVAYFSAEFGLHEVLPIYSGGLGVLSGDHCKSASDLGIPLTAIGLFYKQGYFKQRINHEGWQETSYNELNPFQLPVEPVTEENGDRLTINVDLPGRKLYAQIWRVKVGRVTLYLLDTDVDRNSPVDRSLTSRLYGGDQETRIQQEILLGIGGSRTLEALGINPSVYHMNEGHSAFLVLELLKKQVLEKGLSYEEAKEVVSSCVVFTTHTPVPAGNDVFPVNLMDKYFGSFWGSIGIDRDTFLQLGVKGTEHHSFNMTVLALNLSGRRNGVSELHGAVTRNIFNDLWSDVPEDEVPVIHITNGVHTMSWIADGFRNLYDRYFGDGWKNRISQRETWSPVSGIPDRELWEEHMKLKRDLIDYIRDRIREQKRNNNEPPENIHEVDTCLDPGALTIGFARRFATYKRANLIFRDMERIRSILNNTDKPVQIIFAGKAHPADRPAHEIIKSIYDISRQDGFRGKVIILENYNMAMARKLVSGVDIWLNNPRRPLEASGTSGQKVCINGIINFSVLDGWWCEGYNEKNGWTIGDDTFYTNEHAQDNADSNYIYDTLENQIIPLYYSRNESGIPADWVGMMKKSIASVSWQYSTHRMVQQYTEYMYSPSMESMDEILSENYGPVRELSRWKSHIRSGWHGIHLKADMQEGRLREFESVAGNPIHLTVDVDTGEISPDDLAVEVYYGLMCKNGRIGNARTQRMRMVEKTGTSSFRYSADIVLEDGGDYSYTFRVVPDNDNLTDRFDMGLVKWIDS